MIPGGKLHSDLVGSSCLKLYLQQDESAFSFYHRIVENGRFSFRIDADRICPAVFIEQILQMSAVGEIVVFYDCQIFFLKDVGTDLIA